MAVLNSLRLKTSRQEVHVTLSALTVLTELVLHNLASGGHAVTPRFAWPALSCCTASQPSQCCTTWRAAGRRPHHFFASQCCTTWRVFVSSSGEEAARPFL